MPAARSELETVSSGAPPTAPQRPGYIQVSLTGFALASGVVALTSLAALVVVASIKDVDTLSTVALALAVIAFVAQLIVFVVQAGAANTQMLQSRQLHAELLRLLAELGERSRGTEATVTTMNERLLEAALGKALGPGKGAAPDARALAASVAEILGLPQEQGLPRTRLSSRALSTDVTDQAANDAARNRLQTFPEQPSPLAVEALDKLSPEALSVLRQFANDEIRYAGTPIGRGIPPGAFLEAGDEVAASGLIEPMGDGETHGLTELGREAARMLVALGDPPADLAGSIERWRAGAS